MGDTPEAILAGLPPGIAALLRTMAQQGAKEYAEAQARAAVASGERQEDIPVGEAVERFVRDLRAGKSRLTASSYRSALRRFLAYLAGQPPEERPAMVSGLTPNHIVDFARSLTDAQSKVSRATVQHYSTAVARFCAFLLREGYRGSDFALGTMVERLKPIRGKIIHRLPRVPDDDVVAAIIAIAEARPAANTPIRAVGRLRDIAILRALSNTGVRVAELTGLRRGDLQPRQCRAIVTGKGDRERFVYFDHPAWDSIAAYLAARDMTMHATEEEGEQPVFAGHHHSRVLAVRPLSTRGVRKILRKLVEEAGEHHAGITPHRFRAWFATHMLEATGDLAAVQDFLGHQSPETTRHYATVSGRRLRALHDQAFATIGAET
ncbi:MAG: tyrosine-type recombinase/integrase [Chloroflexota bacterium]